MVDRSEGGQPPTPPTGDKPVIPGPHGDDPAAEDAPVGLRIGRNPANLGDEVPDAGDITYPAPIPEAVPEI